MSHSKIRTEKICLNCGTETPGRYCPACGQENIDPKQSVWHLITHFFSDITHFDGKFFITVKDLFAKPGFLSREYMAGRRVSYLDPIRMYIFTSAFFFLIFFSLFDVKKMYISDEDRAEIQNEIPADSLIAGGKAALDSLRRQKGEIPSSPFVKINKDSSGTQKGLRFNLEQAEYPTVAAYDSAQMALTSGERDGWLKRKMITRKIELNQRYKTEKGNLIREMISNNVHNWPKVLFISLPLFALLLKLLYIRHKQFYYVDHGIFSIHLYIFSFLILLVFFLVNTMHSQTGWHWLRWIIFGLIIYPFFYSYKAMRRFYGQGRGKTILKYILLFILSFFVQLFIFLGAVLFTVFEA